MEEIVHQLATSGTLQIMGLSWVFAHQLVQDFVTIHSRGGGGLTKLTILNPSSPGLVLERLECDLYTFIFWAITWGIQ